MKNESNPLNKGGLKNYKLRSIERDKANESKKNKLIEIQKSLKRKTKSRANASEQELADTR